MRILKFMWDFKGPSALKTSEHHAEHLAEYLSNKQWEVETGTDTLSEFHSVAYLIAPESLLPEIRDTLKPHRAVVYKEKTS